MKLTLLFLANFSSDPAKLTNRISRQHPPSIWAERSLPVPECRQIASTCRAFPGVAAPCPGKRSAGRPRAEPLCRRGKTPRPGRTGCHVPLSCPRKPPQISASGPISAPILKQNARRGQIPGRRAALPVFGGEMGAKTTKRLYGPFFRAPDASALSSPLLGKSDSSQRRDICHSTDDRSQLPEDRMQTTEDGIETQVTVALSATASGAGRSCARCAPHIFSFVSRQCPVSVSVLVPNPDTGH